MRPDHLPTPARIIGELLANHPEAASLLARPATGGRWRSARRPPPAGNSPRPRPPGSPTRSCGTGSSRVVAIRSISASGCCFSSC